MVKKRKSLGPSFSEEVVKVTAKIGHFQKKGSPEWADSLIPNFRSPPEHLAQKSTWRIIFFSAISLIFFFVIFLRLFHLQIARGEVNRDLADSNRIAVKVIHAPRGVIYDRNGKILAANSPAFRLNTKLVSREQALEWEVKKDPNYLKLEIDNVRTYPMREQFAHVVGYVGEVSDKQLKTEEFKDYRPGDRVGKEGIEEKYEKLLRGKDGGEIIEVDSKGNTLRTLRYQSAKAGQNIYLSVEISLQGILYTQMKEALDKTGSCCGAAIAQDPTNGKILALVSFPSYDPNIFVQDMGDGAISEIFSNPQAPILNRVIAGTYPPGSTFKIVSSLAALDSGKINENTFFSDEGVMYLGPYKFSNWYFNQYGKVEGSVNLEKALKRSNDIYFYKVGQSIGPDALADWSKKLRLGQTLEIDLSGEEKGLVPDDKWKQENLKEVWFPGDTLHMAIGQGFVLTTPLQILGITSYIASDGIIYKPKLLLSDKPEVLVSNLLAKEQITKVKKGLNLVPKEGGTAWPFFTFPIETAGKTGTAEYGDPKGKTHAWYTSYAPADDPKIVLTILIEGGGEGSSVAAPVAKEVYRWYFSPDKNNLIKDTNISATDSGKTLGE